MDYAIAVLERERAAIVEALRAGRKERLPDLQELDRGLGWLRLLQYHGVDQAETYHLEMLPMPDEGMSYYYLMQSDDYDGIAGPESWKEYRKSDGSYYDLLPDDIILEQRKRWSRTEEMERGASEE